MKKSTIGILISLTLLSASFTSSAEDLDARQWVAYCKVKKNVERCEEARDLCERHGDVSCDQIKLAFMQRRSLTSILPKNDD
jgi:hypothetical protein